MQVFIDKKAGMDDIDMERIQRIIEENTSAHFDSHAKKRMKRTEERIQRYKEKIATFSPHQISDSEKEMDQLLNTLEKGRDLSRCAVHIDMDAFFAAVEMRDDPSLRHIPMAVGSEAMLSTSNYRARKYGVRSAMPGFIAKKLCPELKIVRPNFGKYRKASSKVRDLLKDYDNNYLMGSLDEAYLDITDYLKKRQENGPVQYERHRFTGECVCRFPSMNLIEIVENSIAICTKSICEQCGKTRIDVADTVEFGVDVDDVVREIRFRVEQATGLTCSAGVAPNSMLAKVCSNINKPNGQFLLKNDAETVLSFVKNLPIRKISGIGPVTEAVLKGIGIEKCGDLYERRGIIGLLFTQFNYEYFMRIACGISHTYNADNNWRRKSISTERTFSPSGDIKPLLEIADNLCSELIDSLPDHNIVGGYTATVKMKFTTFDVITRCTSVSSIITDADRLYSICEKFMCQELSDGNKQLRLIGVRLSRLVFQGDKIEKEVPITSFWKNQQKASECQATADLNVATNEGAETSECDLSFDSYTENSNLPPNIAASEMNIQPMETPGTSKCSADQGICLIGAGSSRASDHLPQDVELPSVSEENVIVLDETSQHCPICEIRLPDNLVAVNQHVDECLNRGVIRELQLPKAASQSSPPKSNTQRDVKKGQKSKKGYRKKARVPAISIERFLIKKPKSG